MHFTFHRTKAYITAVEDKESDRWHLDTLPLQADDWLGCLLEDGPFLLGWNCVEMNQVSERVSVRGVWGDLEGGVEEVAQVERDCVGTYVGQTR